MKISKEIREFVNRLKEYSLSDKDMNLSLSDEPSKIHKYDEIENNLHTVDSLFDRLNRCIIFLPTNNEMNIGHWACMLRQDKNKIIFWESYAFPLHTIFKNLKSENNLSLDYLIDKIKNSGYKLIQNKKRYQPLDPENRACGRFVIMRLLLYNKNQKEFDKLMIMLKNKYGFSPLDVATMLTYKEIEK